MIRIAAILTCYNRREETRACLQALRAQTDIEARALSVFLTDDGSTDGTADVGREIYPDIHLIQGDGSLFWNRGMHKSFAAAIEQDFDFYLWLNNDTTIFLDALSRLLQAHEIAKREFGEESIVVGSVRDPDSGLLSYGGVRSISRMVPARCEKIQPNATTILRCDTFNGNCVLIPRSVVRKVGNLDYRFSHAIGDHDYGFRAVRAGCHCAIVAGIIGTCHANNAQNYLRDHAQPILKRWRYMLSPKGLPVKDWWVYTSRYSGPFWPAYFLNPYVKFWVSSLAALVLPNSSGKQQA